MIELTKDEQNEVNGGLPVAVVLVGYVVTRHYGGIFLKSAIAGAIAYIAKNE